MELRSYINTFLRTVRAYSKREKLLSHLLLAVIVIVIFKLIFLSGPSEYTEGYVGEIRLLNPVFSDMNEVDRDISRLIFSGLMRYSPKDEAVVQDMADLKVSEDKKTYTFTLKPHLKWHDGEDLTASDVYFTFHDVIQNPDFGNPLLRANFDGVLVKQIDEQIIEFSLEKPNSFFIANVTTGILPKHILGEVPVSELMVNDFNFEPVGSGPYMVSGKFKTYSNGQTSVSLKRFNGYYGENSELSELKVVAYPSVEHMVDDRDNLSVLSKITGTDADPVRDDGDFDLIPYKLPQYTALFMNMESKFLKDKKVRVGVFKAIKKETLSTVLKDMELIDTPLLELDTENWMYEPNFDQANGALYDSGFRYKESADRYRKNSDGEVLELNLAVRQYTEGSRLYNDAHSLVAFMVKSWDEVGVKVNVSWLMLPAFNDAIQSRGYDLLLAGQSLGYNLDTFAYWHSSQTGASGLNLSNYKSFKVDTLLEEIRDTFDSDKKQEKLAELATQMADDVPALFLYRPVYYLASDGSVSGINMEGLAYPGDRYLRVSEWGD